MGALQRHLRSHLTWHLNPKREFDGYVRGVEPYLVDQTSGLISSAYQQLKVPDTSNREVASVEIPMVNWQDYDDLDESYLRPLVQLQELVNSGMKEYVSQFILHGSLSTRDYIKGWSDVDTLVVIRKDTLNQPAKLKKFRSLCLEADRFLSLVDPLKHHGLIYCTEYDLENYPSIIMPIEVLEKAVSLLGNRAVFSCVLAKKDYDSKVLFSNRVKVFNAARGTGIFKHHMKDGIYLTSRLREDDNVMYQLKYFLGLIMTMPSYYLEAAGTPCYKAESFGKVKEMISPKAWRVMETSSFIRQEWANKEKHPYRKGNEVPRWVVDILGGNYFGEASLLVGEMEALLLHG